MPRGSREGIKHAQTFRWPHWRRRFEAHVDRTPGHGPRGDCHLWTGAATGSESNRYGSIQIDGRVRRAHQVAWEIANRLEFPTGKIALHSCDVGLCVNPRHIRPGTHSENTVEAEARGRNGPPPLPRPEQMARGERHGNSRLTNKQVQAIRRSHGEGVTTAALARKYGVSWDTTDRIIKRQTWRHVQ